MAILTDAQGRKFEWGLVAISAGCVLIAVLAATLFRTTLAGGPPQIPVDPIMDWVTVGFLGVAVLLLGAAWTHHRWFFSARQRLRRDLGDPAGWLDHHDLRESSGPAPVIAEGESFWARPRGSLSVEQAGWSVGELISGRWPTRAQLMWAPYPRSVGLVGPQGSRKSQYLIPMILDAPGPAVVTSTKPELLEATGAQRAAGIGPVFVFDPLNMTGGRHNFPFDPVWGCARAHADGSPDNDYPDAIAAAMIRGASISKKMNEEFWADAGREILRCYLLAADLRGEGSEAVQRWAHKPDDNEPVETLASHRHRVPPGWLSLLKQRLATNVRQRDGYFATVASCMDYLAHPGGSRACQRPSAGPVSDNMPGFLAARSTLYIVGDKSKRGMAAMMTALTESLAYRAREHAKNTVGRLGEPLALFLDEVANLTPINLPTWASETRGWGIMTVAVIQSRAQLDKVWGEDDGKVIWDNLVTKVILGALGDDTFLEGLSRLAGERRVSVRQDTTHGGVSSTQRLERVSPLHVIRSLPPNHAFVLGIARHPAVVYFEPGYQRLARDARGLAWRPVWPRWWRHPIRALAIALDLGGRP